MYEPPKMENRRGGRRESGSEGPTPSLDLIEVEPGAMSIDLDPERCRFLDADQHRCGLAVRAFGLDRVVVEFSGPWPFELRNICARVEHVDPGGFVTQLRCRVDYDGCVEDEVFGAGVRLRIHAEPEQYAELRRYYRELRFPLLSRGDLDAGEIIELFHKSGYLRLRGGNRLPSPRWCQAELSGDLSSDVVYCAEDGALLGHVSVTRAYSRSWLGHQLTTLRGHPRSFDCRVALYNHFSMVPALYDGQEPHFLLGYYDRTHRWHQLFFEGFVDWIDDASEAVIVPFDRFELLPAVNTNPLPAANDHPRVHIEQPRPGELGEVVAFIHEQLPPLACAAFDIDIDTLDRAYLAPGYAAHGLPRGRRVFVVRDREELVGVALCETGSEDVSLFDVFNLAQIYCRPHTSLAARRGLIEFVRQHYRSLGRERPLLVAPPATLRDGQALGLDLVETMGCIVWSGSALPSYRRYLSKSFSRIRPESLTSKAS
jgi:hypothetical protein